MIRTMIRSLTVLIMSVTLFVPLVRAQDQVAKVPSSKDALVLKTSAFKDHEYIPAKYGCDIPQAQGTPMISPPLEWSKAPKGAVTLALIMHDIGANPQRTIDPAHLDVTHWLVFDIPATVNSLPEGVPVGAAVQGGVQGANVHDVNGYQAPCPRGVGPHYYVFDLYALDAKLNLPPGASRTDLLKAIQGHIIAQTIYTGLYNH
jgi:Raf kinase inhibitor-like YbhB/YbcL family protein